MSEIHLSPAFWIVVDRRGTKEFGAFTIFSRLLEECRKELMSGKERTSMFIERPAYHKILDLNTIEDLERWEKLQSFQ